MRVNDKNQHITIKTYQENPQHFIDRTPSEIGGEFKDFLDRILARVPMDAEILEIGTATGRDADYIESRGYSVMRTDIVDAFVEFQRSKGSYACKFDALTGDLAKTFDLVLASAVFHHFNNRQFDQALENTHKHLKCGGYFALAVKHGKGEEYSEEKMESPRYFRYWRADELEDRLMGHGFEVEEMRLGEGGKWLLCIAFRS
ncbi:class I SAM-dependent methyltransferase [Hoeflea sp. TYP-13]|uniref:class I SAM-dependent methyltransferase n=1 Tax=Hoeflea sp. TYP-13 TaxID=3230023 RepID=UPI0034C6AB27